MLEQCLWQLTSAEAPPESRRLNSEVQTRVCIIGGGITGLSTAVHLQEMGVASCILEADEVGAGGSGRNVGLVNAGMWLPPEDICERLGAERGERANRLLGGAPALVFELIERYAIDCEAKQQGTLHLAHSLQGVKALQQRFEQFSRQGAPVELFKGADVKVLTGSSKIPAALLDRRAGTINPCAYTRGLGRAAVSLGAQLFCQSPVTALTRDGDNWLVSTPTGQVRANQVVLAGNAYTQGDWSNLSEHFFAGYYYQVSSTPLEGDAAASILPGGQGAWDTRTVLSSIRRDEAGRLILGSLGNGERKPDALLRCWANRIQQHYFPQLGAVDWQISWTGRMGFTPDHVMRIYEPAPGLIAASGYNGRGNTTGALMGKGFAHWLAERNDAWLPLPLSNPQPIRQRGLRSLAYETGFSLYHAGQCLRVLI